MEVIPSSISEAIPKPRKLILISYCCFCPRALCRGLSTFETLQCVNHLRFIALSRSQVHIDILHVSFYTLAQCFFWIFANLATLPGAIFIWKDINNHIYRKDIITQRHIQHKQMVILTSILKKNVLEKEIPPSDLSHGNDMGLHLSLCAHGKTPSPGREGNRRLISSLWHLHHRQLRTNTHGRSVAHIQTQRFANTAQADKED